MNTECYFTDKYGYNVFGLYTCLIQGHGGKAFSASSARRLANESETLHPLKTRYHTINCAQRAWRALLSKALSTKNRNSP